MLNIGINPGNSSANEINLDKAKGETMTIQKGVPIILSLVCLIIIGTGQRSPASAVEDIQPDPKPQLNPEPLKEVMIFGASGTVGDGIFKALLMDKNVQKIQVVTRRLTCAISINLVQPHLIISDSYKPYDF